MSFGIFEIGVLQRILDINHVKRCKSSKDLTSFPYYSVQRIFLAHGVFIILFEVFQVLDRQRENGLEISPNLQTEFRSFEDRLPVVQREFSGNHQLLLDQGKVAFRFSWRSF